MIRTPRRRLLAALGATVLTTAALTAVSTGSAHADEVDQIINGTFDDTTDPWWSTAGVPITLVDGRACVDVPGGTVNRWDIAVGQNDIDLVNGESYRLEFFATGTPQGHVARAVVGDTQAPYDTYFEATPEVSVSGNAYAYTFTSRVDSDRAQVTFQLGGSPDPWQFCLDDVALIGGVPPEVYEPDTGPRVRVNQVAYLPKGPKNATLVTDATERVRWDLKNARGVTVATGWTRPRGVDATSGQNVHSINFGKFAGRGAGYTLVADGETSRPFDIDPAAYEKLRTDALKFYYTQRSGIEISDELRPGYGRPAGHVDVEPNSGDGDVPCQPGVCDYRLDVTGGWYDAGDHGKYVVNGGISVWQLLNQYERTKYVRGAEARKLGDGTLAVPESGNKVPDILDEVRWELEFLLKMQVPAGQPLAGMAHHKIHDQNWTGLPLLPHLDPELRELHPVSTAATLNLAATAAQGARLYAKYDKAFAERLLSAARTAFDAALANPDRLASPADGIGGGTYDDANVGDEFYWAAAELFLTTGEQAYADRVTGSDYHTADVFGTGAFDWGNVAAAARLDLALVPSRLPGRAKVVQSVVKGADKYVEIQKANPYGLTYAPRNNAFDWGSNSAVLNNLTVIGSAYDLTRRAKYRDAVVEGMDYLLGRNALNWSYVTGYGEVSSQNQHSRWYARQLDPGLPNPPVGTLSGGPNSALQDPFAQGKLAGCTGQFCYIDDIQSWSTNELTINWNAPLSWVASFVADQNAG